MSDVTVAEQKKEIKEKLVKLIEESLGVVIDDNSEDLIANGKMDSYTMLLLISHVRSHYNVELNMEELDFDAFKTVNSFVDLLFKNMNKAAQA